MEQERWEYSSLINMLPQSCYVGGVHLGRLTVREERVEERDCRRFSNDELIRFWTRCQCPILNDRRLDDLAPALVFGFLHLLQSVSGSRFNDVTVEVLRRRNVYIEFVEHRLDLSR